MSSPVRNLTYLESLEIQFVTLPYKIVPAVLISAEQIAVLLSIKTFPPKAA